LPGKLAADATIGVQRDLTICAPADGGTKACDTPVTSIRRRALGAFVLVTLVGLRLGMPSSVAACLCAGESPGDVVFTGTVVGGPNDAIFLRDLAIPSAGVYTFDVRSAIRGDPRDGRVYSGPGDCTALFELGATYRVHARVMDPAEEYTGRPPDVPLLTGMCMAGELLEPPNPLVAINALAFSPPGTILIVGGLALVAAIGIYLRRRRSTGTPLARSR
jgi:hypothetical protein